MMKYETFSQIFFGSLKNGCIFALAFNKTSVVDKTKQKAQENFELFWNMRQRVSETFRLGLEAETRDESKVEASNSYNEEFDPGSG